MVRPRANRGLSLVELIVSITILSFIAAAVAAMFKTALQAQAYADTKQALARDGFNIMTRITTGLRNTTQVMVPNGRSTSRTVLIFSAGRNEDNDYYRSSSLFPLADEDSGNDMTNDGASGVSGIDDNGDGLVDNLVDLLLGAQNDDEDLLINEDKWDGKDDDSDGSIDEDAAANMNGDGSPGVKSLDDDADGSVDEGSASDDDEDGSADEDPLDPLIYSYNSGTSTLTEKLVATNTTTTLSTVVSAFSAVYEAADSTHFARLRVTLSLSSAGQTVTYSEYVFPRNLEQPLGRKLK